MENLGVSFHRIRVLLIIFLVVSILLSVRIIYLTTVPIESYTFINNSRNVVVKRGDIVDCNNRILAANDELYSIYVNPEQIVKTEITSISSQLSNLLSIDVDLVRQKLSSKKSFIWLKRQITPKEYEKVKELDIKGVYATKEYKRVYPNATLASHILGFCNIDNEGIEGVEKTMNKYLKHDNDNDFNDKSRISNGYNIQLTIDSSVQAMAEKALNKHASDIGAESGCLVLLDGKTGEVVALANYPDYNPNYYNKYSQENFRNNAIFYQFEPGSVFKVFTMAGMIANGGVDLETLYFCNRVYSDGFDSVKCTGRHGYIDLGGLFKTSCNVATLQAAETINKTDLYYYLKAFGFGETTDVELPGEQQGVIRSPERWTRRSMLAVPIGQEVSTNAMQIVQAATTLVNDGQLMRAHLVRHIYDNNGKIIKTNSPKVIRRVLPEGLAKDVVLAMGKSTDEIGGSVKRLKVDGINFAAKSGTAQMYDAENQRYSTVEVSSSILAVFPMEEPRYIVYTVLHRPKSEVTWGGVICSYLLNDFISSFSGYLDIYPPAFSVEANKILKDNTVNCYKRISSLPAQLPDLRGISAGDACDILSEVNVHVYSYGTGKIYRQEPAAGTTLENDDTVKLYLKEN